MARPQGWTLIEALVTLAVATILMSLAVPPFTHLFRDSERAGAVNAIVHAIFLARSETAKRGQVVSICKSQGMSACVGQTAAWHEGWIVFVDEDRDGQRNPNEPLLLVNQGWQSGTITSNRQSFAFRPYNQAIVNGTIVFCDARGSAHARALIVSHSGRPRIATRDANNKPLKCPP